MAPSKSALCTAALMICFVIVSFQQAEAQCGGFQTSCSSFSLASNGVFSAKCTTTNGASTVSTSINLNNYISNSNGNLIKGNGFASSCTGLGFVNQKSEFDITGNCKMTNGNTHSASYNIGYNVVNSNGQLKWNNC